MSKLQNLIDDLNDTNRAIADFRSGGDDKLDEIESFNLASIMKRQQDIALKIDVELAATQNSMIQYRIIKEDGGKYPAKAVGEAMERFQDLLTSIYDALIHGPKRRFRPSIDSIERTTLNFAGATAGSVKITLAAEDDRLLLGDTTLERALLLVEKTLSAQTTEDLSFLVQEVGIASVSRAYEWSKSAAGYNLKTEISWGKSIKSDQSFLINADDASRVSRLIERQSDDESTHHQYFCILHGFDKKSSYFHIETLEEREDLKGEVGQSVSEVHTTGKRYTAKLTRSVKTLYATGEEKIHWTLDQLIPFEENPGMAMVLQP
jgi:hypothetical protein